MHRLPGPRTRMLRSMSRVHGLSRRVRHAALSLVPGPHRATLRRLYDAATVPTARAAVDISENDTGVWLTVRGGPRVQLPASCRQEIDQHFGTREAAAELHHFWREARVRGVLFDVGANNGLFSALYCLAHPLNRAVAFEPSPTLVDRIRDMARLNGIEDRVRIIDKAAAESAGERELLLAAHGGFVQPMPFAGTAQLDWHAVTVRTTTLDIESAGADRPTIVKIDVEGYEWEVLRGATALIRDTQPTVFLEVHLNYLERREIAPLDVIRLVTAEGYELSDLSDRRRSEYDVARSWASVLHLIARPTGGPVFMSMNGHA
jgi:FkbM family methyltransferase